MKILNNIRVFIVYSAMHTGTWFAATATAKCLPGFGRSDEWIQNVYNKNIETLALNGALTKSWAANIISRMAKNTPKEFARNPQRITLQGHHYGPSRTKLYKSVSQYQPEIPVIVPVRNPLLTLNTYLWRIVGSHNKLHDETKKQRKQRAIKQVDAVIDMLILPPKNVIFFPIDTPQLKDSNVRRVQCIDFAQKCGLEITPALLQFAEDWTPVNTTIKYKTDQQDKIDRWFNKNKQLIINNKLEQLHERIGVELDVITAKFARQTKARNILDSFGYKLGW